jgi:hypothetical protein
MVRRDNIELRKMRIAIMNEITGTYRGGHVELASAVDWPDGTPVTVQATPSLGKPTLADDWQENWGIEDDWPDTPENRAEILRRIDAVEPLEMTPEEEAEWKATLNWFGDYTLQAVKRDMGLEP